MLHDRGYALHRSIEQVKCALSREPSCQLRFDDPPIDIATPVTRPDFEAWIADELAEIERCLDELLTAKGVVPDQVDSVFLTGGTSFVPRVRRIFEVRFGTERIHSGGELTSVASGLALRGLQGRH